MGSATVMDPLEAFWKVHYQFPKFPKWDPPEEIQNGPPLVEARERPDVQATASVADPVDLRSCIDSCCVSLVCVLLIVVLCCVAFCVAH